MCVCVCVLAKRQKHQWQKIEGPEIVPRIDKHLLFEKVIKTVQERNDSTKGGRIIGHLYTKVNFNLYFRHKNYIYVYI